MTMRPAILSILLLITVPSMAQRDGIVCFTMAEAELIHDTLWSAVNHRRARVVASAKIWNLETRLKEALIREADEKARADRMSKSVAGSVTAADQYRKDAEFWEVRAGRNTGKGIAIGVGISVAAYFGGRELVRALR
jgi:competence protein ComGC